MRSRRCGPDLSAGLRPSVLRQAPPAQQENDRGHDGQCDHERNRASEHNDQSQCEQTKTTGHNQYAELQPVNCNHSPYEFLIPQCKESGWVFARHSLIKRRC